MVGASITWTDAGTYQYNTAYNIYLYPVSSVEDTRLSIEYDNNYIAVKNDNYTNNDGVVQIKTQYVSPATTLSIDSGKAYSINVNTSLLNNISIDKMEVK